MLTRFRRSVSKSIEKFAKNISELGMTPNKITLIGLIISFLCPFAALKGNVYIFLICMVISSFMDVLDGAVARVSQKVTKFGSILDSFSDRIEETMYMISLEILGVNRIAVTISIVSSFLISYLRALGEKQGLVMEGIGLMERGERLILVIITGAFIAIGYLHLANIVLIVLILLCNLTIVQRITYIYKNK
ncbi:MAG: CDP-alcohol phosphatidyltransferase family protein [Ignisphaera sp.]|uniref:CDP-alcohol phosphatidyltransferase family protein n=1 Tax=Ignisphaera aggregans TaxID=334771 RepID=A0A7J3MZN3_9CREN